MRNFLATLLLSQGVPMLAAGDELARTQVGNNNAYCQDNETSWIDWAVAREAMPLLEYVRQLIALRRGHIVFHRWRHFQGTRIPGTEVKDVTWLRPDGAEMTPDDWNDPERRAVGLLLSGEAGLLHLTETGEQEVDDTFCLLFNASAKDVAFALPASNGGCWRTLLDTAEEQGFVPPRAVAGCALVELRARSLQLLVRASLSESGAPAGPASPA
jgi:glycogen operon protein